MDVLLTLPQSSNQWSLVEASKTGQFFQSSYPKLCRFELLNWRLMSLSVLSLQDWSQHD